MFLVKNHIDICLITKDTVLTSLELFIGFLQSWLMAIRSTQKSKNSTDNFKLALRSPEDQEALYLLFVNMTFNSDQEETALKNFLR